MLERVGDKTVQTAALEAVTKTRKVLLRDQEIIEAIRADQGGGDILFLGYQLNMKGPSRLLKLNTSCQNTTTNRPSMRQRTQDVHSKVWTTPRLRQSRQRAMMLRMQRLSIFKGNGTPYRHQWRADQVEK